MSKERNHIENLFNEMVKKGLASTGSSWIHRASAQRNPHLTVEVANSFPLVYEVWDVRLAGIVRMN